MPVEWIPKGNVFFGKVKLITQGQYVGAIKITMCSGEKNVQKIHPPTGIRFGYLIRTYCTHPSLRATYDADIHFSLIYS
jgi:hypothetical protein